MCKRHFDILVLPLLWPSLETGMPSTEAAPPHAQREHTHTQEQQQQHVNVVCVRNETREPHTTDSTFITLPNACMLCANVYCRARTYYYLVRGRVDRVAYQKSFFLYIYIYVYLCIHILKCCKRIIIFSFPQKYTIEYCEIVCLATNHLVFRQILLCVDYLDGVCVFFIRFKLQ